MAGSNATETANPLDRILADREAACWLSLNSSATTTTHSRPQHTHQTSSPDPHGLFCPGTFDGWSCWPSTPAGTAARAPCPEFITGFDPTRMAHKECNEDGTWFIHPETGHVWSNYTTCVDMEDLSWRRQVNRIYETGYLISLAALLISLGLFTYFKALRCTRIMLHINLFVSFAINNSLWLLWYRLVVEHPEVIVENGAGCQILHVVLHYFLLSNYLWMFCEGLYLHTLLVAAFLAEERLVRWLYALGWVLPAVVTAFYATLRGTASEHSETAECWIHDSRYTIVLVAPVCASMVISLLFLCNIVRVLVIKLRAGPRVGARPSRSVLQAVRATLLLLPLLGLHYLLTPFRPEEKASPGWQQGYEVLSAITASFQGLCVAILFCFCNGEVIGQVKRKWQQHVAQFRPRANSCTATTVSFVRSTAAPLPGEEKV